VPRGGIEGAQLDQWRQLLHAVNVDENGSSSAEFFAFAPDATEVEEGMADPNEGERHVVSCICCRRCG
jgi:hypothetical protein